MKALKEMLEHRNMGEFIDMKIKIVGSAGDQDEVNTIRNTTEIFLIERRIREIVKNHENKSLSELTTSLSSEQKRPLNVLLSSR